jgi:hypothetical protein
MQKFIFDKFLTFLQNPILWRFSMMYKFFLLILLLFAFGIHAHSYDQTEKKYVSAESVRVENGKIYILLADQWVATPSLHSDAQGVYVDQIKLLPWFCTNCNRWTTGWFCCDHCGALPDK